MNLTEESKPLLPSVQCKVNIYWQGNILCTVSVLKHSTEPARGEKANRIYIFPKNEIKQFFKDQ